MDGDRTQRALLRIDKALTRIEAAAAAKPAEGTEDHADLVARHARLRGVVTEAIDQLDLLIAGKTI